jgi:hypothetical protein
VPPEKSTERDGTCAQVFARHGSAHHGAAPFSSIGKFARPFSMSVSSSRNSCAVDERMRFVIAAEKQEESF